MYIDVDPFFEDYLSKSESNFYDTLRSNVSCLFLFPSTLRVQLLKNTCFIFELHKPFNSQINLPQFCRRFPLERFRINAPEAGARAFATSTRGLRFKRVAWLSLLSLFLVLVEWCTDAPIVLRLF